LPKSEVGGTDPSPPVVSKTHVEMPRRPQTQGHEAAQVLEITSEQIRVMTDHQLRELCSLAGIASKPGWKRSRLLSSLVSSSVGIQDY